MSPTSSLEMAAKEPSTTTADCDDIGSLISSTNAAEAQEIHPRKGLRAWQALIIIISLTCSLGALCLPKAVARVGIIPFAIIVVFVAVLINFTGLQMWHFQLKHPEACTYPHMIRILFSGSGRLGAFGYWVGGIILCFALMSIMATHINGFGHVIQDLSHHHIDPQKAAGIGTACMGLFSLWRPLKESLSFAIVSCVTVIIAITVGAVGVGLANPGAYEGYLILPSGQTSAAAVGIASMTVLFVFMVHTALPPIISEMEDKREFPWVLRWSTYVTVGIVLIVGIYFYAVLGDEVKSPILDCTKRPYSLVANIAASPTIMVAGTFSCKVASQVLFDPLEALCTRRGSMVMIPRIRRAVIWSIITIGFWTIAFFYGVYVPEFEKLVPLTGSIFAPWFCIIFVALFWVVRDGPWSTAWLRVKNQIPIALLMLLTLVIGVSLFVFGLYGNGAEWSQAPITNSTIPQLGD